MSKKPEDTVEIPPLPTPAEYWEHYLNDSYETLVAEPGGVLWLGGVGRMTGVLKMKL